MGKRDIITKEYLRKNEIFADACNFLLYDGRQVIRPEDLSEKDTNELVRVYGRNNKPYLLQKYRDVLKNCIMKEAGDVYYIMIGMEGQSEINHAMVVRNLLYDAISYSAQVKALADKNRSAEESGKKKSAEFLSGMGRSDRLMPVITITVHFGQETWDAAKSLHELFEVPDRNMLEFIPDYRINLITPAEISRFDKFRTTLGPVLNFIKNSRDAAKLRELVAENETFQELDVEVAQLLGTCVGMKLPRVKGGSINMCKAIEDMVNEGKREGRAEGKAEGKAELIFKMHKNLSVEEIAKLLELTTEEITMIIEEQSKLARKA